MYIFIFSCSYLEFRASNCDKGATIAFDVTFTDKENGTGKAELQISKGNSRHTSHFLPQNGFKL